nr:MAG TPA: hypothetical protein [Caudoviricetes sp.]
MLCQAFYRFFYTFCVFMFLYITFGDMIVSR